MDTMLLRFHLLGCCVATLTLAGCKTVPVDRCNRPPVAQPLPLRLNVSREVRPHSLLAILVDKTTNQPVESAVVSIDALHLWALTDTDGVAVLLGIPKGAHTVATRKQWYVPRHEPIMSDTAGVVVAYELRRDTVVICDIRTT